MAKSYKAYLFDWDGTLCRTLEIWITTLRETFAEYDIHPTDKEFGRCLGDWPATMALGVPADRHATFKAQVEMRAYEKFLSPPLYDGAVDMLKRLKAADKKLALITTSRREAIEKVLIHHGLIALFDMIITGDDVKAHKPDPEGILSAIARFKMPPAEVVMIGDTDKDLGAAKNAGIDSILFYPSNHADFYDYEHLISFKPVQIIDSWHAITP